MPLWLSGTVSVLTMFIMAASDFATGVGLVLASPKGPVT